MYLTTSETRPLRMPDFVLGRRPVFVAVRSHGSLELEKISGLFSAGKMESRFASFAMRNGVELFAVDAS